MGKGLFDSVLDGWPEGTGKEGTPHPWPVLHTLNREYHCAAWPEDDGGGLVLYPDAGLLASEKTAALRFAQDNLPALLRDTCLDHLPRRVRLARKGESPESGSSKTPARKKACKMGAA